jgi:hypothetical protein
VASVLLSAAVKKIVPILSPRVKKVVHESQDVHSFFQEESFKIRSNQPV